MSFFYNPPIHYPEEPLLHHLLPTGEKKFYDVDIDDRCQEKYKEIVSSGCWLFIERNPIGFVLQYIENGEQTIDISASRGGYWENKAALEKMILNFDSSKVRCYDHFYARTKHDVRIAPCVQSASR